LEDLTIVEQYLARKEEAIKNTSEKYGRRLRSLSHGIVQDNLTAEECENDTYLDAWNSIPPNEPRDYFYAFLACITRHISLNRCREKNALKRKAYICELSEEMEECIPASSDVDSAVDDMVLRQAINGYLSTLSEDKRNIFLRRYWFLDNVSDISKRFGITESKVKTTLFRCRNGLRQYLEKEGYSL